VTYSSETAVATTSNRVANELERIGDATARVLETTSWYGRELDGIIIQLTMVKSDVEARIERGHAYLRSLPDGDPKGNAAIRRLQELLTWKTRANDLIAKLDRVRETQRTEQVEMARIYYDVFGLDATGNLCQYCWRICSVAEEHAEDCPNRG
jgi:hypothetical protein